MLPILGALGLVGAGPFVATLLVARSGVVPSARWLGLCLASWAVCVALAWAVTPGTRLMERTARALTVLAPLAALTPVLPVFYRDDAGYHLARSGATPAWLMTYAALLLAVSIGWQLLALRAGTRPGARPMEGTGRDLGLEAGGGIEGATRYLRTPMLLAALAGVALMLGLNDLVFGPLGRQGARPEVLALNVACAGVAGWLVTRSPVAAVIALVLAAVGPASDRLSTQVVWLAPLLGAAALAVAGGGGTSGTAVPLSSGRATVAGALWGLVASLTPPAAGALPLLAAAKQWRPALAGVAVAAFGLGIRLFVLSPAGAPSGLLSLPGDALLENAALSGFFARLFTGAGGLTSTTPVGGPAAALTLGALAVGGVLALEAARYGGRHRHSPPEIALAAPCLGLTVGLLLGGSTPVEYLPLAALALVPLARLHLWRSVSTRQWAPAACAVVAGLALLSTTVLAYARAAGELLSAWPAVASAPALGLVLLALALAHAMSQTQAAVPGVASPP